MDNGAAKVQDDERTHAVFPQLFRQEQYAAVGNRHEQGIHGNADCHRDEDENRKHDWMGGGWELLLKLFEDFWMLGDDFFDEIIDVLERFDLEQILIVAELDLEGMLNACDQIHDIQTVEFKVFEDFLSGRQILRIEFDFVNENLVD